MASLLWLQGGACSGNTMSFLNAEEPSACDLVTDFGIDVLWHPSLGMDMGDNVQNMLREITSGNRELDIFVFEGTVIMGPNGTGKSTLAKVIAGHEDYTVESGEVLLDGENILGEEPDEIAKAGLFLAFQC